MVLAGDRCRRLDETPARDLAGQALPKVLTIKARQIVSRCDSPCRDATVRVARGDSVLGGPGGVLFGEIDAVGAGVNGVVEVSAQYGAFRLDFFQIPGNGL